MASPLPVDIGVFFSPALSGELRDALKRAAETLASELDRALPGFQCRLELSPLKESDPDSSALAQLEQAVGLLEERRLDFALFATHGRLQGARGNRLVAAASQLFGCAVFQPEALGADRAAAVTSLARLLLRLLAALNGTPEDELPEPEQPLAHSQLAARLQNSLRDVADQRLEEAGPRRGRLQFYVKGLWLNRRELAQALVRTRPWLFPTRLSHLMAGALSASALIMLTAEAWELALAQPWQRLVLFASLSSGVATVYLLKKQRLLSQLRRRPLTERRVTAEVASVVGVSLGMLATFVALFALTAAVGVSVYSPKIVENWSQVPGTLSAYAKMAGLTATLGMVVGALGASFETPTSFRYLLVVDRQLEPGDTEPRAPAEI